MASKNTDPRMDVYIAKAAGFAKPILRHLRKLVHEGCPDAEETMKWSSPTFVYRGKILCGMSSFQSHCAFGFWHQGMTSVLAADGHKSDTAAGSFGRLTSLDDLPSDKKLLGYVRAAAALNQSDEPARPRPARQTAARLALPDDLAAGLKKRKDAAATFERLSPSHRKEYIEWITEAKRDETRQKRLATTLEWLAEGKSRNWKYQNC